VSLVVDAQGQQLFLELADRTPPEGHILARVPIQHSDLRLARDETWWRGVRKGRLDLDLGRYEMQVLAGPQTGPLVDGYSVQLTAGDQSFRRHFPVTSLNNLAQQQFVELVVNKSASLGEAYKYYLTKLPAQRDGQQETPPLAATQLNTPPKLDSLPLADLLAASRLAEGPSAVPELAEDESPMHVFVTEDVWEECHQMAFRGGEAESGALISGRLCRDTQSPEVFVCFEASLEARHAVEEKFSVEFTGETWSHIRNLLEVRRQRLNRPHELIVASVHRHPWLPASDGEGKRTCDACPKRDRCTHTTATPSAADFEWHQAVFAGQPWGTLLIWGYTAREEEDFRLYGLRNAAFHQQPIRLLPSFPS
jgi:hypothetical protein